MAHSSRHSSRLNPLAPNHPVPTPTLDFLLVPDAGAARRLRRLLAEAAPRAGVLVGTWRELLEQAALARLPTAASRDWSADFEAALARCADAFWARSLEVAPRETVDAVAVTYGALVEAAGLAPLPPLPDAAELPARIAARYRDFRRLHAELAGSLPETLDLLRRVLAADPAQAIRRLRVAALPGYPELTPAQARLVQALNAESGEPPGDLVSLLVTISADAPRAEACSALGTVQARLFAAAGPAPGPRAPDDSLQWIGCRDFLEEAELAAGIVQRRLAAEPSLSPRDFALLLPDDYACALAVEEVFQRAGLALSGLPREQWRRDLGREAVSLFLQTRPWPAPLMAGAALLTSPLMPWPAAYGRAAALALAKREALPPPPDEAAGNLLELLSLRRESKRPLRATLERFSRSLNPDPALAEARDTARAVAMNLVGLLGERPATDLRELQRLVAPGYLDAATPPDFNLEGVTIWRESQEPWRATRHLLVLGFVAGHYPAEVRTSPVFTDDEFRALGAALGLPLPDGAHALAAHRARFRRQLAQASDSASFFVARRKPDGKPQRVSESHVFIAEILGQAPRAEELVLDVDDPARRAVLPHLALAAPALAAPPPAPDAGPLEFARDLLTLRTDAAGRPKPESPSGLETLLVSPLAWLLMRLHCEPQTWAPEQADRLMLGTLAHAVLEALFEPGASLPSAAALAARVPSVLDEVLRQRAPYLLAPQWTLERNQLAGVLARAAANWRDLLQALDARVLARELTLGGRFHGIDLTGSADLLLEVEDGRLLVVDYKLGGSNQRRERMQKRFDSQVELYRRMLESGGPVRPEDAALAPRLAAAQGIGLVYYMLNDHTALTDTRLARGGSLARWEALGPDVSARAIALIAARLDAIRAGRISLNGAEDAGWFKKEAGLSAYALDRSPLLARFVVPGVAPELAGGSE
jgi:ATP-dependent helicase/nuclease subunit B